MNKIEFAKTLKTLGEGPRLSIFCYLLSNKKVCVSEVAAGVSMSVATTSHHLKKLEEIGIVSAQKTGKEVCYIIEKKPLVADIKKLICKYIPQ